MAERASERTCRSTEPLCERQWRSATSDLLKAAKFLSEDSDRRVFRRFDEVRVFVLLRLQHRLAAMANRLEALREEQDARNRKGEADPGKDEELYDLAVEIEPVLKDYDDTFWAQARFESIRSPSADFMLGSLKHYAARYPLLPTDLGTKDSEAFKVAALAPTAARNKSAFHRFVDKHEYLRRFFAINSKRNKKSSAVFIYSELAISRVERMFVHVSFCVLLLCPIIALSFIQSAAGKLGIVVGFLLLAAFLTSGVLTGANNAGLAVLAGYGAILIFFLGIKVDFSSN